jgi:S-adenosylmethionine/arginine decarboxylase-like enzyme
MHGIHDSDVRLDHEILILDAYLRAPLSAENREQAAQSYIGNLLNTLGMEKLGPMQFHDAADLRAPGWSFIQPITTSHIGVHYFEKPGRLPHVRIDVYSCKTVDWRAVVTVTDAHMQFEQWRATFIHRGIESARKIHDIHGSGAVVTSIDIVQDDLPALSATPAEPAIVHAQE